MKNRIRTVIAKEGQSYLDRPVVAEPKRISPAAAAVQDAFNAPVSKPLMLGYERVRLNWMRPNSNGDLVHCKPSMPSPEFYRDDAN